MFHGVPKMLTAWPDRVSLPHHGTSLEASHDITLYCDREKKPGPKVMAG